MNPVLITGGSKGLGAAICQQLAQEGHDVVVHYHTNQKSAEHVAKKCREYSVQAVTHHGDFTTQASLEHFLTTYLERFSKTKGLVNNVGNYLIAPSRTTLPHQWQGLFQTNFFAPVFLTQALLPYLCAAKGCVVNIGLAGLQANRAFTQSAAYTATKSALLFYTLSLAKEMAAEFVRVNMVSPGFMENATDLPDSSKLPFQRPAFLSEVALSVASFFRPSSHYITGQNLEVAGGIGL